MDRRACALVVSCAASCLACGGAPVREPEASETARAPKRSADVPDDCAPQPGKPPPAPLKRVYTGVASKARCDREIYTIMGGLTHFLGVKCEHCHVPNDYPAMTHRKRIANWMARELIPAVRARSGGEVWCGDCHKSGGKGTAKILKDPRDRRWAIEWMATHLTEGFEQHDGEPLNCKDCHGANVGSPDFKKKIILSDLAFGPAGPTSGWGEPAPPAPAAPAPPGPAAAPPGADAGAPAPPAADAGSP